MLPATAATINKCSNALRIFFPIHGPYGTTTVWTS
ncbi:hypothetical protein J2Y66_004144 [Paenarthrobacter nitroguajacolicus]|nr:hypothetical protein [Paenarthrobacter nitroguajacolicus]